MRTSIGAFGNRLTSDPAKICEELCQQYDSVFSKLIDVAEQTSGSSERNSKTKMMDDIIISEGDFIETVKMLEPISTRERWHTSTLTEKDDAPSTLQSICVYFGMSH